MKKEDGFARTEKSILTSMERIRKTGLRIKLVGEGYQIKKMPLKKSAESCRRMKIQKSCSVRNNKKIIPQKTEYFVEKCCIS